MPRYLATLTIVLWLGIVLARVAMPRRQGVRAMNFDKQDETDFHPTPRLFYFYLVFADVFGWPTVSRGIRLRSDGLLVRTKSATSCRAHGLARVSETSQN
jgi:hypothetical protein